MHRLTICRPVITYIISILQAVKERAEAATRAPPTAAEAQAVEQYLESPQQQQPVIAQAMPVATSQPQAVSQYGMGNQNMYANAGNQNYIGSLVQVCAIYTSGHG